MGLRSVSASKDVMGDPSRPRTNNNGTLVEKKQEERMKVFGGRKVLGGIEVRNLAGAFGVVIRGVKPGDETDARFFAKDAFPEAFPAVSGAGERPNTRDDDA